MLAAVFVIAVLGVALTSLLGLAERRIDAWRVEAT
jgi:ABC-type nitrate/sulfonate/bicarbonate transport system permease component